MANDITNELTFAQCSKERCREILEAIQRDDIGLGSINFHKIIPQPSFRTDKECLDWRIKNWDTKWEAYGYRDGIQYDEDKQQIRLDYSFFSEMYCYYTTKVRACQANLTYISRKSILGINMHSHAN